MIDFLWILLFIAIIVISKIISYNKEYNKKLKAQQQNRALSTFKEGFKTSPKKSKQRPSLKEKVELSSFDREQKEKGEDYLKTKVKNTYSKETVSQPSSTEKKERKIILKKTNLKEAQKYFAIFYPPHF